jgi:hypothetical protein
MTQSNISTSNASFPKPKRVLLGEQTVGTLLANIVHIFRRHFGVVVGAAVIPVLPAVMIVALALSIRGPEESQPALIVAVLLFYIGLFLVPAVLTVVLSDICLGNTPTLKRAFARVPRAAPVVALFHDSYARRAGDVAGDDTADSAKPVGDRANMVRNVHRRA